MRVDKWLWTARMFKHRTAATRACTLGDVTINGLPAKPSKKVAAGDQIEALTPGGPRILEVVAIANRRGPATEAQGL